MEYLSGKMESNIKDNGQTENSMEQVYIKILKAKKKGENGLMEKDKNGFELLLYLCSTLFSIFIII